VPGADQKKLEQFDRAWGDAADHGDRAHLQGVYADDYAGLGATGSMSKTQTIDTAVRDSERARTSGRPAPKVVHDYYVIGCTPATATITHPECHHHHGRRQGEDDLLTQRPLPGEAGGIAGRSSATPETRSGDSAVLLYMEREWNDAELARDYAWHERNYSDDFSGISSRTGALSNKSEDIASSKKATVTSADLSEMDVRVEGDTAGRDGDQPRHGHR
jgi:hypothetical protein